MLRRSVLRRVADIISVDATTAQVPMRHRIRVFDADADESMLTSIYVLSSCSASKSSVPPVAAFVDNFNSTAIPRLVDDFNQREGMSLNDVKYIIVTHVHLDHAAGTGTLLRLCPNAKVLCHPRAQKHLVDPSALISSARRVYTPEDFVKQVGDMVPCDPDRVRTVTDGEIVELAPGRPLQFHFVEGHAKHHVAIHDPATRSVFTGDAFGASYEKFTDYGMQRDTMFVTSSPVDFDANAAVEAVDLIASLPVRRVFPTHFGAVEDVQGAAAQLRAQLPKFEELRVRLSRMLLSGAKRADVIRAAEQGMQRLAHEHFIARGLAGEPADFWKKGRMPLEVSVNALGLVVAAERFPVAPPMAASAAKL